MIISECLFVSNGGEYGGVYSKESLKEKVKANSYLKLTNAKSEDLMIENPRQEIIKTIGCSGDLMLVRVNDMEETEKVSSFAYQKVELCQT